MHCIILSTIWTILVACKHHSIKQANACHSTAYALRLDNEVSQTWAVRDVDLELLLALLGIGIHQLVVC